MLPEPLAVQACPLYAIAFKQKQLCLDEIGRCRTDLGERRLEQIAGVPERLRERPDKRLLTLAAWHLTGRVNEPARYDRL